MPHAFFTARLRLIWLILGATTGVLLAASGLIDSSPRSGQILPANSIARVGERLIPAERYRQLLSDLAADKRAPLKAADRRFVVDRLIDEELLIMRGIELGLPDSSPQIRKAIASAVIAQVSAEAEAAVPDEAALRRLYASDAEYFSITGRYHLRWWRVPGSGSTAKQHAIDALAQLGAGTPIEAVTHPPGLIPQTMLPDQMLPLSKLADYLGPELTQEVLQLEPGEYSRPVVANGSFHILYLVDRQAAALPEFEQVRPLVEAEYLRRRGDQALRDYLGWLRQRTRIVVNQHEIR